MALNKLSIDSLDLKGKRVFMRLVEEGTKSTLADLHHVTA